MNDKEYKALILDKFNALEKKVEKLEFNLSKKISNLESKLLHPDAGLFARVKENTLFRKNAKRIFYIILTSLVGIISYIIRGHF